MGIVKCLNFRRNAVVIAFYLPFRAVVRDGDDPCHPRLTVFILFTAFVEFGLTGGISVLSCYERIDKQIVGDDGSVTHPAQGQRPVIGHSVNQRIMVKQEIFDGCSAGTVTDDTVLEIDEGIVHHDQRITGSCSQVDHLACSEIRPAQISEVRENGVDDTGGLCGTFRSDVLSPGLSHDAVVNGQIKACRIGPDEGAWNVSDLTFQGFDKPDDNEILQPQISPHVEQRIGEVVCDRIDDHIDHRALAFAILSFDPERPACVANVGIREVDPASFQNIDPVEVRSFPACCSIREYPDIQKIIRSCGCRDKQLMLCGCRCRYQQQQGDNKIDTV